MKKKKPNSTHLKRAFGALVLLLILLASMIFVLIVALKAS